MTVRTIAAALIAAWLASGTASAQGRRGPPPGQARCCVMPAASEQPREEAPRPVGTWLDDATVVTPGEI